jgi:hypothetical protein
VNQQTPPQDSEESGADEDPNQDTGSEAEPQPEDEDEEEVQEDQDQEEEEEGDEVEVEAEAEYGDLDEEIEVDEDDGGLCPAVRTKPVLINANTNTSSKAKKTADAMEDEDYERKPEGGVYKHVTNIVTRHNQALRHLLPQDKRLTWAADLDQPEIMANMVRFVAPFHSELTMFVTDRRRMNKDGSVSGFRGVCVDAMDANRVSMTIARVEAKVRVDLDPGEDLDKLPSGMAADEASVTVDVRTLGTVLRDVRANETMVMYVEEDSCDLSIAVTDSSGETNSETLRTKSSLERHKVMNDLKFSFELSVPLNPLKNFTRRAGDIKATSVRITYHEITSDTSIRVLCLYAEGDDATMFKVIPVSDTQDLDDLHPEDDEDGTGNGTGNGIASAQDTNEDETDPSAMIAALKAASRSSVMLPGEHKAMLPVKSKDLQDARRYRKLYSSSFSVKYLHNMISQLCGSSQLTLFLGADSPLLMRFDLGKRNSYVAFALAARVDEEEEEAQPQAAATAMKRRS